MLKSLKIDLQPLGFKCFNLTANKSLMQYLVLSSYPQGANPKMSQVICQRLQGHPQLFIDGPVDGA